MSQLALLSSATVRPLGPAAASRRPAYTRCSAGRVHLARPAPRRLACRATGGGEAGNDSGDEPPQLMGDWRAFRAKLVADTSESQQTSRKATENFKLLQRQNPNLAAEGLWCHPADPEKGGLLIAAPEGPEVLQDGRLWQTVIFLTKHDAEGTIGLILNRPSAVNIGALPMPLDGLESMQSALGENRLYFGGFSQTESGKRRWRWRGSQPKPQTRFRAVSDDVLVAEQEPAPRPMLPFDRNRLHCGGYSRQEVVHLIHGHKRLEGAQEIVPGIYCGGERAALQAVSAGELKGNDFRFFAGCMFWEPGQLAQEVASAGWISAASSRSLVLKQCLGLPTPLWKEAMELMGGSYGVTARETYGDLL